MNDSPSVRLKIFWARSQHSTQLLIRSQHGAQPVGTNPVNKNPWFLKKKKKKKKNFFFFAIATLTPAISNFSHVSQHDAQMRVHPKPNISFNFTFFSQQIATLTSNSEHETKFSSKKKKKHFNFFSGPFFQFPFFSEHPKSYT